MKRSRKTSAPAAPRLPLEASVGYQTRLTHRLVQRLLQARIAPYGVQLGMWYFLRVLWDEDGLTQRELSHRIGVMEPTTLHTLATMERRRLITRVRNAADRRKTNIFLTPKGRHLQAILLPIAAQVVKDLTRGFTKREAEQFVRLLRRMQANARVQLGDVESGEVEDHLPTAPAAGLSRSTG